MLTALGTAMLDWHSWSSEDELYCLWWPQVWLTLWNNSTGQIWYRHLWFPDDQPDKLLVGYYLWLWAIHLNNCWMDCHGVCHTDSSPTEDKLWWFSWSGFSRAVLIRLKNSKMCNSCLQCCQITTNSLYWISFSLFIPPVSDLLLLSIYQWSLTSLTAFVHYSGFWANICQT